MCSGLRGVSNAGVPSTAYMLLFKLYTLQLTTKQITVLIEHSDSVYIRALGFLYLRHCCDPKQLWKWCVEARTPAPHPRPPAPAPHPHRPRARTHPLRAAAGSSRI